MTYLSIYFSVFTIFYAFHIIKKRGSLKAKAKEIISAILVIVILYLFVSFLVYSYISEHYWIILFCIAGAVFIWRVINSNSKKYETLTESIKETFFEALAIIYICIILFVLSHYSSRFF